MRINKYFTDSGYCSRRAADKLIESGRVKINGRVAVLGDQISESDEITLDGKKVIARDPRTYIMYNKPMGVICTTDRKDPANIIDAVNHSFRVFPIGRLDKNSTGLILLTNDGEIVNKILRAQYGHEKEYRVQLESPFSDAFIKKMSSGVDIGGYKTKPCKVTRVNETTFLIILTEGKNRQIRKMVNAFGMHVKKLHRIRIMNIEIGDLKSGEWKEIPAEQFAILQSKLQADSGAATPEFDTEE